MWRQLQGSYDESNSHGISGKVDVAHILHAGLAWNFALKACGAVDIYKRCLREACMPFKLFKQQG